MSEEEEKGKKKEKNKEASSYGINRSCRYRRMTILIYAKDGYLEG